MNQAAADLPWKGRGTLQIIDCVTRGKNGKRILPLHKKVLFSMNKGVF